MPPIVGQIVASCLIALAVLAVVALERFSAHAQSNLEPAAELIGGSVFAIDGTDVGEVSAVTLDSDGQIDEVRVTTASRMGFGERVVILRRGTFVALRGAVQMALSVNEFNSLPSAGAQGQGLGGPAPSLCGYTACDRWEPEGGYAVYLFEDGRARHA